MLSFGCVPNSFAAEESYDQGVLEEVFVIKTPDKLLLESRLIKDGWKEVFMEPTSDALLVRRSRSKVGWKEVFRRKHVF